MVYANSGIEYIYLIVYWVYRRWSKVIERISLLFEIRFPHSNSIQHTGLHPINIVIQDALLRITTKGLFFGATSIRSSEQQKVTANRLLPKTNKTLLFIDHFVCWKLTRECVTQLKIDRTGTPAGFSIALSLNIFNSLSPMLAVVGPVFGPSHNSSEINKSKFKTNKFHFDFIEGVCVTLWPPACRVYCSSLHCSMCSCLLHALL